MEKENFLNTFFPVNFHVYIFVLMCNYLYNRIYLIVFIIIDSPGIFKITLAKCLIVLEMLNFSLNFFFYIICSKTSRSELQLILYYYFYWRWSKNAKKYIICNHPNHNRAALAAAAEKNNHQSINGANLHQHRLSNFNQHLPNNHNEHDNHFK